MIVSALALIGLSACSTQKNTWAARNYHALTTRYNVRFNGQQAYERGLNTLEDAYKEDYSELLPVYIFGADNPSTAASSAMSTSVEKCEKAIKTHSIRVKPEKKPSRSASQKEKDFYNQEEFNPVMGSVFLLMAKSQFYQTDFLSSMATCSYILKHFPQERTLCDEARLWMARSYLESDWVYEAENIFAEMNRTGFDPSLTGEYSMAYADFLIRRGEINAVIPYVEIGLSHTRKRSDRQRYSFLLAQLYQQTGQREKAYDLFRAIPRQNPPYEMDLNARIRQTEVYEDGSTKPALRKLKRMSRNPNNRDYLDAIYYAMGNIHFSERDTLQAVECYQKAIDESTQNGPHKMQAYLHLGDYYYGQDDFLPAQPCYAGAKSIIKESHPLYEEVQERDRVLGLLQTPLQTIFDEDSLQAVASLPVERLFEIVDSLVIDAKRKAREEARRQAAEEALGENASLLEDSKTVQNDVKDPTLSFNGDNSWYFYSETAKAQGKKEFDRLWGRRTLADNWRIRNQSGLMEELGMKESEAPGEALGESDELPAQDETAASSGKKSSGKGRSRGDKSDSETGADPASGTSDAAIEFEPSDDPTERGYYLKDLPLTEEQRKESDRRILESLYQAAVIYREQMQSNRLALETFAEMERRFPDDSTYLPKAYYVSYLMLMQQNEPREAESNRRLLLANYPDTEEAALLRDSFYLAKLERMYESQDSLFEATYQHFLLDEDEAVKRNCDLVDTDYPSSELRPNFLFVRALVAVKKGDSETFHEKISEIVSSYPQTDLGQLAKTWLGYWDEGRRPEGFTPFGASYAADSIPMDSLVEVFEYVADEPHHLMVELPDSINANRLLFDVALYNFTNFLIRDYELSLESVSGHNVLMVRSFENAEDVMRYISWMNFQGELPEVKYAGIRMIPISESNLSKMVSSDSGDSSEEERPALPSWKSKGPDLWNVYLKFQEINY